MVGNNEGISSLVKSYSDRLTSLASSISSETYASSLSGLYKKAIQACGELYRAIRNEVDSANDKVRKEAWSRVHENLSIHCDFVDEVTHIVFDDLLPIRYFYLQESDYVDDFCRTPMHDAIKLEELKPYRDKVVVCFINHFANGARVIDPLEFELKPVIDQMKQMLFYDDDPRLMSLYLKSVAGEEKNFSEIYVLPVAKFQKFVSTLDGGIPGEKAMPSAAGELFSQMVLEVTENLARFAKAFTEAKENSYHERTVDACVGLLLSSGGLLNAAKFYAYQAGIGDYDIMAENDTVPAENVYTSARKEAGHVLVEGMIERHAKGQPADKRRAMKVLSPERFKELCDLDGSMKNGMTLFFSQHFGKDRRFTDHDNFATEPYAAAIKRAVPGGLEVLTSYYMDCDDEKTEKSSSEIYVIPTNDFRFFLNQYLRTKEK